MIKPMFNAIKSQKISAQILLPVFGFIPFLTLLIWPSTEPFQVHNAQGFFNTAYKELLVENTAVLILGSFFLVALFATLLFWVNTTFEIIGQRTVILSYIFFLVACAPLYLGFLHPGFLGAIVLYLGLISIFSIYHSTGHLARIFNGGILFGLSILFYPPYVMILPVFIIAVARMKQPRLNDYLVLLLGPACVFWIYGGYLFLTDKLAYEWISILQWFEFRKTWPILFSGHKTLQLAFLIWIVLMLPLALALARSRKDVGRRIISVLLHFLWIPPVMVVVLERPSYELWGLASVPISVLFSLAVMNSRSKWLSDFLVIGLILFLIVFQIERLL